MEIDSLQRGLQVSKIPLERLAGSSNVTEAEKTAEVSRQFEAILLKQILQQSQKHMFPSALAKDTAASGIYQDMITNQLADGISKSGTLGLAKSFKSQLSRQVRGASTAPAPGAASKSDSMGLVKNFKSPLSRPAHGTTAAPKSAALSAKTNPPKHS